MWHNSWEDEPTHTPVPLLDDYNPALKVLVSGLFCPNT